MFYSIISLFSSKLYNDIFHFSLFLRTQKNLEEEILNGSLKNNYLKW